MRYLHTEHEGQETLVVYTATGPRIFAAGTPYFAETLKRATAGTLTQEYLDKPKDGDEGVITNSLLRGLPVEIRKLVADDFQASTDAKQSNTALKAFLARWERNPNRTAAEGLWDFIEANGLTITVDGYILCYKGVCSDLSSASGRGQWQHGAWVNGVYASPIYNTPGSVIALPRQEVVADPRQLCSRGLHVGNQHYWGWSARGILVAVDPEYVCSVPHDYNGKKMRVAAYTPIGDARQVMSSSGVALYRDKSVDVSSYKVSDVDAATIVDDTELRVPPRPTVNGSDAPTGTGGDDAVVISGREAYESLSYSKWGNFRRALVRAYDAARAAGQPEAVREHGKGDYLFTAAGLPYLFGALDANRPDVAALADRLDKWDAVPYITTGRRLFDSLEYSTWGNFRRVLVRAYEAAQAAGVTTGVVEYTPEGSRSVDYLFTDAGLPYLFGALDTTRPDVANYAETLGYDLV